MDLQHRAARRHEAQPVGVGRRNRRRLGGRQLGWRARRGGAQRAAVGGGSTGVKRRHAADQRIEVCREDGAKGQASQQLQPPLHHGRQRVGARHEEAAHVADEALLRRGARQRVVDLLRGLVELRRRRPLRAQQADDQRAHLGRKRAVRLGLLGDLEQQILPSWKARRSAEAGADEGYDAASAQLGDEVLWERHVHTHTSK